MTTRARLPATVVALGVASFFTDVSSEMMFPLLPAFVVSLGASPTFLGLVEGLANATAAVLKYASGVWVDRVPRKKPLVVTGYALAAVARPLVALAVAPWHVLAMRVTDRVGKGLRTTPRDVLLAQSAPVNEAGRAFGFHQAMDHAGAVVGPLVATGLLALSVDLRTVFAAAAIPGVLGLLCVVAVREAPASRSSAPSAQALPTELPKVLWAPLAIFGAFVLGTASDAFMLLRASELGVSAAQMPLLWGALHVSRMVWSAVGGSWSDRLAPHRLIAAAWLVFASCALALSLPLGAAPLWVVFVVYGGVQGLVEPVEKNLLRALVPEAQRGRGFGLYNALLGLAAVPAGLFIGELWELGGAALALPVSAGVALVSTVAIVAWGERAPENGGHA